MRATKENYFNKKVQRVKMEEETKKGEKQPEGSRSDVGNGTDCSTVRTLDTRNTPGKGRLPLSLG